MTSPLKIGVLGSGPAGQTLASGFLEALSLAWVVYSHRTGKNHHAFKLAGRYDAKPSARLVDQADGSR